MLERLLAVVAALTAALSLGGVACAQTTSDPYQIFARSRGYWLTRRYPPLVEYHVAVSVLEGRTLKVERYWSAYDSVHQGVIVDAVSDYELAHPTHAAHGLTVNIPLLSFLSKPQPPTDYLGVPALAPNYTFGMARIPATKPRSSPDPMQLVAEIRAEFHDPDPRATPTPLPTPAVPHVIERETVYERAYRVRLQGIETIGGSAAYHLKLHALRDPGRYRLEDLWVDTRTYAPLQLVERINFVDGPGTGVPWRVTFAPDGDALYVRTEQALAPMRYRGLVYLKASVSFQDVHAVDRLSRPAPLFLPHVPLILREPPE
jgi:hypothetical protein